LSDDAAKHATEMRLVAQSAFLGNMRKRMTGRKHLVPREIHSLSHDVSGGSFMKTYSEGAIEMAIAESNQGGELAGFQTRAEVFADIRSYSLGLPRRQTAAGGTWGAFEGIAACHEQGKSILKRAPSLSSITIVGGGRRL